MKTLLFIVLICFYFIPQSEATPQTAGGIRLDTPWREKLYEYAQTNIQHSIWA